MAKLQTVEPKTKEAIRPKKRYYIAKLSIQLLQLVLQGVIIYLLLK